MDLRDIKEFFRDFIGYIITFVIIIVIFTFIGLLISAVYVLVTNMFDNTVKTEKVNDEEWKIALFTVGQHSCLSDYHFLRFNKEDNIWYHKNGYRGNVFNCDFVGDVITNPQECCFINRIYDKSFALKLKK